MTVTDHSDTLVFIASLLERKNAQRWFDSQSIDETAFVSDQRYIRWVLEQKRLNGRYPSKRQFERRFSVSLPKPDKDYKGVMCAILDLTMFSSMSKIVENTQNLLESGKDVKDVMVEFKKQTNLLKIYEKNKLASVDAFDDGGRAKSLYDEKVRVAEAMRDGKLVLPTFPWPTLRALSSYIEFGEMIVFSARTSMGKTWMAIHMAVHWAMQGFKVVFYSLENPESKIIPRITCHRYGLPYKAFRDGLLTPKQVARWNRQARKDRGNFSLTVIDTPQLKSLSTDAIHEDLKERQCDVAVVDGAYLLKSPNHTKNTSMADHGGWISKDLVSMTKMLGIITLAMVQQGRDSEEDKANQKKLRQQNKLAKVYGTDQWAQDTDYLIVMAGIRAEKKRELILEKGRESAIGSFYTNFLLNPPNFDEMISTAPPPQQQESNDEPTVQFKSF